MCSVPTCRPGLGSGSADAAGTLAEAGAELAAGVAPRRAVASGLGALVGVLLAGLHAKTVHERVPSRKVLRLTSNPIPRLLALDRPGSSQCFRNWQANCHVHATLSATGGALSRIQTKPRGGALLGSPRGEQTAASVGNRTPPHQRQIARAERARAPAASCGEEDGAEAFFPLRGTTTAAGSKARCASSSQTRCTEATMCPELVEGHASTSSARIPARRLISCRSPLPDIGVRLRRWRPIRLKSASPSRRSRR
jgi:hypothetical protein